MGQVRNELSECRGVTNCERLCQFSGKTAVKSLQRAICYQKMRCFNGGGVLELGGHCDEIIAHLYKVVKWDAVSGMSQIYWWTLSESGYTGFAGLQAIG